LISKVNRANYWIPAYERVKQFVKLSKCSAASPHPQARMRAFSNARHLGVAGTPWRAGRELAISGCHIRWRIWLGEAGPLAGRVRG
jgi:hypothetical protein